MNDKTFEIKEMAAEEAALKNKMDNEQTTIDLGVYMGALEWLAFETSHNAAWDCLMVMDALSGRLGRMFQASSPPTEAATPEEAVGEWIRT